ncbi:polyribonucleotide 5'-hydroxyl-kinase Clp1 [Trichonephila inaurata madagascariensis]|uniref:Polyribonucleotide 5'-hydroxyl-kinase Clp1 n=1 Tax=Trichonephila inaurata madagascariensis TaxID=2747483 RepID=A0A8X7CPR8_9ARAC|nr:polyribonucleotide 5'-hydroxyl-kinase Clp1 [Trichonephila inaurata madagascariensis]
MAASENSKMYYNLEIENELRIIVGEVTAAVKIKLISGFAEIFGAEMELNKTYTFSTNACVAIFTWHGCTIVVTGNPLYVALGAGKSLENRDFWIGGKKGFVWTGRNSIESQEESQIIEQEEPRSNASSKEHVRI